MKQLLAIPALALVSLSACATTPAATPPAAAGSLVPLGQPVQAGSLVVTPVKVAEDSRCPENARCVWAGRLVVTTRIAGDGWRETADLTLGEAHATHGTTLTLVSGQPEKRAGAETPAPDYRFAYEGGA
ncbi:conserved hypothetical protein [Altererythrobacter sp. B11]|uniref:hypothetical protein n=1 Tax=Altererythrobacter sp. B11 TaxID=2060312 RepID=UPI000DC7420E|nr:hypothetical protein [Altererythrobacter sp. B11]BBC72667.1 conserved hypothetical protein [Altererythrobacter sp. B11]